MTADTDWGLHFLIGLQPSPTLTPHDREVLSRVRPAGVVLFRDNFHHGTDYEEWLGKLAGLLDGVRETVGRERLLVGIDHEGGRVHRTPPPISAFPAAVHWPHRAREVGRAMGVELRSLGFNVDFAPVVDVGSCPNNPAIGDRAFSDDPGKVTEAAREFIAGLESGGVQACLKHYPGHGHTEVDSHEALPTVTAEMEVLAKRELVPYRELVSAVDLVMTAHVSFPAVEDRPATLSPYWLTRVLRQELGFHGLVTSDDIGMHAVSENFLRPTTAVESLAAGCDWLMVCAHLTDTRRAIDLVQALSEGAAAGRWPEDAQQQSRSRIEEFLNRLPLLQVEPLPEATLVEHEALVAELSDST